MEMAIVSRAVLGWGVNGERLGGDTGVLGADVSAIVVLVVFVGFIAFVAYSWRKKRRAERGEDVEVERPVALPASKERFGAAGPAGKQGDGKPAKDAGEVLAKRAEAKPGKEARAEPRKEAASKPGKEARAESRKEAEGSSGRGGATARAEGDATSAEAEDKREEMAAAEAKAEADRRRVAEREARAEAARAAEARDRALKEAAELAKAEAKAKAEAEARAKAEARRREAEAKEKTAQKAAGGKAEAKADVKAGGKVEAKADKPVTPPSEGGEDDGPQRTLEDGLGKTRREGFVARLTSLFAGKQINDELLDEVEEALFTADIGARTADRLLRVVREALSKKELKDSGKVWEILRKEAQAIFAEVKGEASVPKPGEPHVTMLLGVNGAGKTTSIGKLSHKWVDEGRKVVLVAGDTFRAAAAEQLEHWGRRVGAACIRGKDGADPASVVFDGVKQAMTEGAEFILVDTAGRLQSNVNLMEELKKVRRVMGRAIEGAPHEVLLVIDATTGQNAISQARLFKEATDVTGIILTKLDGTAKGGVVLGICDELKIPIRWVGIGERVADLRPFDAQEFVETLFRAPE